MSQLQKLLQTYFGDVWRHAPFGAMRRCLVCSSTVGATNLWDPWGIHSRVNGDRRSEKTDTGAGKRERLKRLTLLSSIKASTIVD